jgi:hypothetical protein
VSLKDVPLVSEEVPLKEVPLVSSALARTIASKKIIVL